MPKKKHGGVGGGAHVSELNELHQLLIIAAKQQLQTEMAAGEVKPQTLNVIRQLMSDNDIQPSRDVAEAMDRLAMTVEGLDLKPIIDSYASSF